MSRPVRLPQSRRHIWVYDEDWEFLTQWFGATSNLKVGPAIREFIHQRVQYLKATQFEALDRNPRRISQ